MALFLKALKIGGRCASIVPDGVLFGSSKAHKAIRQEIVDNDYDLSINKDTKTEYVAVTYPPTSEILDELDKLNEQIIKEAAELRNLLGE